MSGGDGPAPWWSFITWAAVMLVTTAGSISLFRADTGFWFLIPEMAALQSGLKLWLAIESRNP